MSDPGRIAVFAPSPLLTVTIEAGVDRPEVHIHAGGQGFWVARLAATLGRTSCCAAPWAASAWRSSTCPAGP